MPASDSYLLQHAHALQSRICSPLPAQVGMLEKIQGAVIKARCLRAAVGDMFAVHSAAAHSAQARLLAQVDILFNAADRYLCIAESPPGQREKSDREHLELLDACRRRDGDAAADVLRRHIGDAAEVFETLVRR